MEELSEEQDVFRQLWELAESRSISVRWRNPRLLGELLGFYEPKRNPRGGWIRSIILRGTRGGEGLMLVPPEEWEDRLPTFAHEFGHYRSDAEFGGRTPAYVHASYVHVQEWPGMGVERRRLILEEETRAWRLGQETLEQLGLHSEAAWGRFSARREESLLTYRRLLDLPRL